MMNAANLCRKERCKLFKEAFNTAALLDGLTIITRDGVTKTIATIQQSPENMG